MCLACAPRHTTLIHFNDKRGLLADGQGSICVPGQSTPWRVISNVLEFEDEPQGNPYGRLRASRGSACTHSNCRANDTLPPYAGEATDTTQAEAESGKVVRAQQEPGNKVSFLRWLYKSESYSFNRNPRDFNNLLGILGIDDGYPSQVDLTSFMAKYRLEGIFARFYVEQVNDGKYDMMDPFDVASVTVQYASAMAFPESVVFYSVGGDTVWTEYGSQPIAGDMYFKWLKYLLEDPSPPPTILIGYGEPERNFPEPYARAICDMFSQLGGKGVSILVASGWNGVGEEGNCYNATGRRSFVPEFPASCTCGVL